MIWDIRHSTGGHVNVTGSALDALEYALRYARGFRHDRVVREELRSDTGVFMSLIRRNHLCDCSCCRFAGVEFIEVHVA